MRLALIVGVVALVGAALLGLAVILIDRSA